jgi:hypothetical protein
VSAEFDEATLAPTYRLVWGVPGRSNALNIAARLGIPEAVVQAARGLLGASQVRSACICVGPLFESLGIDFEAVVVKGTTSLVPFGVAFEPFVCTAEAAVLCAHYVRQRPSLLDRTEVCGSLR